MKTINTHKEKGHKNQIINVADACWSLKALEQYLENNNQLSEVNKDWNIVTLTDNLEKLLNRGETVLIPIYNKYGGNVSAVFNKLTELTDQDIQITSIIKQKIDHKLFALPNQNISDIHTVYSHPQALSQCSQKIQNYGMNIEKIPSTSDGVQNIESGQAYLLDSETGEKYGLECYDSIMTADDNQTYFIEVKKKLSENIIGQMQGIDIGVIDIPNKKGSLLLQLLPLALSKIDLKQITSHLDIENNRARIGVIMETGKLPLANKVIEIMKKGVKGSYSDKIISKLTQKFQIDISNLLDQNHEMQIDAQNNTITVKNEQGALLEVLALLESHDINLSSIQSKVHDTDKSKIQFIVTSDKNLDNLNGEIELTPDMKQDVMNYIGKNYKNIKKIGCLNN